MKSPPLYRPVGGAVLAFFFAAALEAASAATYIEVAGSALGGGAFSYDVNIVHGGLVTNLYGVTVAATPFTNLTTYGTNPDGWTNNPANANAAEWDYATAPFPHSVSASFYAESSETGVKTGRLFILFGLTFWYCHFGTPWHMSAVGYTASYVPVPCPQSESDGVAATLYTTNIVARDPEITSLTDRTLTFEWPTESTVNIQASSNLVDWSHVAYALGYTNTTTWTSAVPLSAYGSYFRAELISLCHNTNLAAQAKAAPTLPQNVLAAGLYGNRFAVNVETERDVLYTSAIKDTAGNTVVLGSDFLGTGTVTTIYFPIRDTDEPLYFDIRAAPTGLN